MARDGKSIAGRKDALAGGAPTGPSTSSSPSPLAKAAIRSQSQEQFHDFVRALARELARQDHAKDADT